MSFSVSTLLLFILISPGFLLRFYLNHRSLVRRVRIAPDALHAAVLLLLYALVIHIISIITAMAILGATKCIFGKPDLSFHYTGNFEVTINGKTENLYPYVVNHFGYLVLYVLYTLFIVYVVVCVLIWLSKRLAPFARLLYGPLYRLVLKNPDFVTAFILTSISHQGKQVMYSGFAKEVGIKDGSKIDYVVLDSPIKFYISLTGREPKTTLANARSMDGLLFLDCDKAENVHFQDWQLN
jgi:hypothetical protein